MAKISDGRMRASALRQLDPKLIDPNPENPRIVFRQNEMESLLISIDQHSIQVPLTVYSEGKRYKLIDGERRWRCAIKLGLRTVPVLVQEKPTELENLVLMYNIHALREQWDYFTIASKLERVIALFERENDYLPNERELSNLTGLTIGAIRRCQLLLKLPPRFKTMLMDELEKPKAQQQLSEDFFIEMERALGTVRRRLPEYDGRIDDIRDTLIEKFRNQTISAVTDFRQLSKIATAVDSLGLAQRTAKRALDRVFDPAAQFGIREAYEQTVQFGYGELRAIREAGHLNRFLDDVIRDELVEQLESEVIAELQELRDRIDQVLAEAGSR